MNALELTGRSRSHVAVLPDPACIVHFQAVTPFLQMRRAARAAGFDLRAESSFRDFDRQASIWNGKFRGDRPLYAADGSILDVSRMSPAQRVDAILLWSAVPGSSRHHWGTDLDLFDANAVPDGYRVQLAAAEYAPNGPFGPVVEWLAEHASRFGFFRPYRGVLSGVQAEAWHFSFAPVAEQARRALTPEVLRASLETATLSGKELVTDRLDELHARYVAAIDWP